MNEHDEIPQAIEIMRGVMADFEFKALAGDGDPADVMATIKTIIHVVMEHGRPARSKKPLRGVGYSFDDAIVVAHLPDYQNLRAALRAHYPTADEDKIRVHERRIREHTKEIEAAGMPDYVGGELIRE